LRLFSGGAAVHRCDNPFVSGPALATEVGTIAPARFFRSLLATTEVRSRRRSRISKALANETRLLIFEAISRNKEMTSSTIVTLRPVAAATVSHHLKILSHAGLVECRRQGQFVHNRAVPETIEDYAGALLTLSQGKG